ncbi:hypothetical protein J2T57_003143 [Natronocella acetinitrilica]|uniref:Uncharacterized protein n=1 Tax=Natronocella acetinitrilica TaxID=414046 RepID=A0AAE3G7T7_9GAMM|nr:hypothetical protein [Natronocella acetinitrilica]MCP1675988.1 hypothetical protein [Natronocella acetinitrilica]
MHTKTAALSLALLLLLGSGTMGLAACDDQGPAEEAGEQIDDAAEDAADSVDDAVDD